MKPCAVSSVDLSKTPASGARPSSVNGSQSFDEALRAVALEHSDQKSGPQRAPGQPVPPHAKSPVISSPSYSKAASGINAVEAYRKNARFKRAEPAPMSGFQKYKDDQLLRNPGGRNYYLDGKKVVCHSPGQSSWALIRKDLSDVFGNIRNFFSNMFSGASIHYRNEKNEIKQGQQRGLFRSVADFFKNLGSALSFGAYHPSSAHAPRGFKNRLLYSVSRLKDAFMGDILTGVPSSANHMAQNLMLAGWHLVEVLPDAVTGDFGPGQKLTTAIFDNGHVAVEYLTDIIPTGDAWLRVHASNLKKLKLPVLYNLKMPEHYTGDLRWEYVRNTPFRKSIETIGALLADALLIGLIGQTGYSGNRRHQINR